MPAFTRSTLFVQIAGIGDFVLALPLVAAFRRTYPECSLELLTHARVSDLARASGYFDAIHEAPSPESIRGVLGGARGIWRYVQLGLRMRQRRFHSFVSLKTISSLRGRVLIRLLCWLTGAAHTVGRNTEGRGEFFNGRIEERDIETRHELEFYRLLGEALAVSVGDGAPRLEVEATADLWADEFLQLSGRQAALPLIGVHAGAFRPTRRWPVERFAELARRLQQDFECEFLITGGPADRQLADYLENSGLRRVMVACGGVSLPRLIALLNRVDLFVTNDTGPMHLAAALQRPTVAIFGPGELHRFRPALAPDSLRVLRHEVECAPCYLTTCSHHSCMEHLTVDEVYAAARDLLVSTRARQEQ